MKDEENDSNYEEDEFAISVAASLKVIRQLIIIGKLTPEAIEVLRKAAYEFLGESYRHEYDYRQIFRGNN